MKLLLAIVSIVLLSAIALAQAGSMPRFEDYSATVYKGRVAPLKLESAKEARTFRTRLREGANQGVNFAGHYTVAQWGCGAGCLQVAIIDAKTGAIFFPKELSGFGVWYWGNEDYDAVRFKPNSRLLVISGSPANASDAENPKSGFYYYEWTGNSLKLIKLDERKREQGH